MAAPTASSRPSWPSSATLTSTIFLTVLLSSSSALAFAPARHRNKRRPAASRSPRCRGRALAHRRPAPPLLAAPADGGGGDGAVVSEDPAAALPPAPLPPALGDDAPSAAKSGGGVPSSSSSPGSVSLPSDIDAPTPSSSSSTTFMLTREMRRVLIEELRYTRGEVDALRVELAGPIVDRRVARPPGGMPESWRREEGGPAAGDGGGMLGRLERESRYPLRTPLLVLSLVLGGKGLADAIITLIKVSTKFPGASLTEEFMGVNVLGIDLACVVAGIGLGSWTWRTMKD